MILAQVMQELADCLDGVGGLRAYGWPAGSVELPAAVVGYPERIDIGTTYQDGCDELEIPVWLVCGQPDQRATRDVVSELLTGSISAVAALHREPHVAFGEIVVSAAEPDVVRIAGVDYLAVRLTVQVSGDGG